MPKKTQKAKSKNPERQRKSASNIKELENNLTCKSMKKLNRRSIHSVSLSKSNFAKEARMSYDALDRTNKLLIYKTNKGLITNKKTQSGLSKKSKACSKLNKHIESTFGLKSVDKLSKKNKTKTPILPLPSIYQNK